VLSSVGPVRMGWWIEDVIVIWERVVERRWRGGKKRAYIGVTCVHVPINSTQERAVQDLLCLVDLYLDYLI